MRRNLFRAVFALVFLAVVPAMADEAAFKQYLEQSRAKYIESFNKKDSAGLVSLYTADALQVNATGAHKVTTAFFDEFWKIGDIKHHATFEQVAVLNPTTATATGTWQWTGKAANGSPIDTGGYWTGVYVKDGDSWKIKMITAGVKAPPPALKSRRTQGGGGANSCQLLGLLQQERCGVHRRHLHVGRLLRQPGGPPTTPSDAYGNGFQGRLQPSSTRQLTQVSTPGGLGCRHRARGTWHITGKDKDGKDLDAVAPGLRPM